MKKRVIVISSIIAGIIVIGLFFFWVLMPRITLYKMVNNYLPSIDKSAEYFTDFSITNNDVITINNGYVSLKIPSSFKPSESSTGLIPYLYQNEETQEGIMLMAEQSNMSDLNLLNPTMYKDIEGIPDNLALDEIIDGFEMLGNGLPDSAYGTYKCMLLTDRDDYSFWNLKKGICFSISAVLKEIIISSYDEILLYEKDDIRGLIFIYPNHNSEDSTIGLVFDIYNADDLNTVQTLIINVNSLDTAYGIINSVEFI